MSGEFTLKTIEELQSPEIDPRYVGFQAGVLREG
jgi:hypothetical protein